MVCAWRVWGVWATWAVCARVCMGELRAPRVQPRSPPPAPPTQRPSPTRSDLRGRRVVVLIGNMFTAERTDNASGWQRFRLRDGYALDAFQQVTGCVPVVLGPSACKSNRSCFILSEVADGSADISFVPQFVRPTSYPVQFSPVLHHGYWSVVVPRGAKLPALVALVHSVGTKVWAALGATIAATALTWCLCEGPPRVLSGLAREFVRVTSLLASVPLTDVSALSGDAPRVLAAACSAASVIFSCIFAGALVDIMTTGRFGREVKTLKELDSSGLPIIAPSVAFADGFRGHESELLNNLDRKLTVKDFNNEQKLEAFSRMALKKDFAMLMSHVGVTLYGSMTEYGPSSFLELDDHPSLYSIAYVTARHSPYAEHVAEVTGWLLQAGLMAYWYEESVARILNEMKSQNSKSVQNPLQVIHSARGSSNQAADDPPIVHLGDLRSILVAFALSLCVAAFVLLGEMLMDCWGRRDVASMQIALQRRWVWIKKCFRRSSTSMNSYVVE